MRPIRAVVVDDEPLARDELTFLLAECGGVEVIGQARDAESALQLCAKDVPDLVFADLRMPGPDGVTLAQALRRRHPEIAIVVVSAHDEGALRAFEAEVIDYLLKPVRLERLHATLERVRARLAPPGADGELRRIAVRRKGALVVLDVADVAYFEVRDDLVWAVTDDERWALDLTLSHIEQRLPAGRFFRSHRAALVRVDRIRSIEPTSGGSHELVLDHPGAPRLPLSRERTRALRALIPVAG